MTELRRRIIEELRLRNYSPNTITVYIRCVAQFAQHFRLSPDRLGPEHIRQYQLFLVQQKKLSWSPFNQTVCALRFFYHDVLHRKWMIEHIPPPRAETAAGVESRRSGRALSKYAEPQASRDSDDHLRRGPAGFRAHQSAAGRYRQPAPAHLYPSRQRP